MEIPVLYEDANMLVVNKPAGLPVHAGPKGGDNVESLIQSRFDPRRRLPHLAHRLDRDTSGCLVFGKTQPALKRLNHIFATRQVQKTYLTITDGEPLKMEGVIDAPLAKRNDDPRSWWMEVSDQGQAAQTAYKILAKSEANAFIECHPRTGRTHQIRVHMAHIGCPIVGDGIYNPHCRHAGVDQHPRKVLSTLPAVDPGLRQDDRYALLLHASRIILPFEGQTPIEISAPLPEAFQKALVHYKLTL